jgi:hypothetical protein
MVMLTWWRVNVAAFQFVLTHHGELGVHHFLRGERDFHAQDFGAVEQALSVLFKSENRRAAIGHFVGSDTFKSAAAVVQGVAQHMDFGVAPVDHLAVHPNLTVAVFHRRGC